jgi:hypothetical protein
MPEVHMIRYGALVSAGFALLLFEHSAFAQAMVEYGIAAGAASSAAAPAAGIKSSIGGMFKGLDNVLKSAPSPANSTVESPAEPRVSAAPSSKQKSARGGKAPVTQAKLSAAPAVTPRSYEDASTIATGIGYEELVRRFGPPRMVFTNGPNSKTMSYLGKNSAVQVELQGGKVISALRP